MTFALKKLLTALVTLTLGVSSGALEWKATTLSFRTVPFQPTQEAVFEFRNTSSTPVTLLNVQTNCDCLDATVDQKIYAPGEGGTIKAVFKIGERPGVTERVVTVVTDESSPPIQLQVRIDVAEIASIAPRTVAWRISEEKTAKILELKPASGLEINFTNAQPTNPAFIARLEIVEVGKHYRLHLEPVSTTQPASAAIRIFGREKSGRDVIISAYANVQ